jgi:hypothetical protein
MKEWRRGLFIENVDKMCVRRSEISSPHQNKEKRLYQYMSANSFRGIAPVFARPQIFTCGTLKTPNVFSSNLKGRKRHFNNTILMPVKYSQLPQDL